MRLSGAWLQTALDPRGVAIGAGPVGHSDRTNARPAELSEGASMPLTNVGTARTPKITSIVGVILALLWTRVCRGLDSVAFSTNP